MRSERQDAKNAKIGKEERACFLTSPFHVNDAESCGMVLQLRADRAWPGVILPVIVVFLAFACYPVVWADTTPNEPSATSKQGHTTTQPSAFGIERQKKDDAIQIRTEEGKTIFTITSPSGIGEAKVECKGDRWPDTLILRIHLRGLESLAITSGDSTLRGSVLSHSGNPGSLHLSRGNEEGRQLSKNDPCWMDIQALDAQGRPVNGLPDHGGWFEMTIPRAMLADQNKTLTVRWIDFYR